MISIKKLWQLLIKAYLSVQEVIFILKNDNPSVSEIKIMIIWKLIFEYFFTYKCLRIPVCQPSSLSSHWMEIRDRFFLSWELKHNKVYMSELNEVNTPDLPCL